MEKKINKFLLGLLSITLLTSSIFTAETGHNKSRKKRKADNEELNSQPATKKRRINPELQDTFYNACQSGNLETINSLLNKIDINQMKIFGDGENKKTITPLCVACKNGHTEVVKALIESGKIDNINLGFIKDKETITPLYSACENGHTEVVKALLESREIDINLGWIEDK